MSIYAAIIVRNYAEGRICMTTDRIGGYLTNEGGYWSLWRNLLEWTGQKKSFETITIGVINSAEIPYKSHLEKLSPISFQEISLNDVTHNSISQFDLLYFIGLPTESGTDLETVLEEYTRNGGGLYLEVPDISGDIEILKEIESVSCKSINRPLFGVAYWTPEGKEHYVFVDPVYIGFLTTLNVDDFSSEWTPLMTNITSDEEIPAPENIPDTTDRMASEFGVEYSVSMQHGLIEIDTNMSTSSSSSFDSSSSSSSSSGMEDTAFNFCPNIVAYWKMDDNASNAIVWDESNNFKQMGLLKSGSTDIYTANHHISGKVNGALTFDGFTNKVETSSNLTLNFNGATGDLPFSISFWLYSESGIGHLLCKSGVWEVYLLNSILYLKLHSAYGYRIFYMDSDPIPLDKWKNITLVYDGTLSGMKMYLDSKLKSHIAVEDSYTTMKSNDSPFYMASNISSSYWKGYLDNIYILDKAINEIEVEVLWGVGNGTDQCEGVYQYTSSSSTSSISESSESEGNTSSSSSSTSYSSASSESIGNISSSSSSTNSSSSESSSSESNSSESSSSAGP